MQVALRYYEGLVRATASRCMTACEEDFEDIAQVLRIKVWQAVRAWDPQKSRTDRDKYVFMCVRDRAKDVVKKKKRNQLAIEDCRGRDFHDRDGSYRSDGFDGRYLCSTRDENFAGIEDDDDLLVDLDDLERAVAEMLVAGDYTQAEIAVALGVMKAEVEKAMKTMRLKLAGLRPRHDDEVDADVVAPHHPRRRRRRAADCCVDLTLLAA